ncbi:hypothetical protein QJS10_CPA05g00144 [Acorus calamus]|uniref:YTH domain-containing family protein n=1 Tax=Acorus calamus TaxID=4465 RepID=A0AAV9EVJ8_ACOCL|nr:hypothetical protein QJS10_CPA05g00144 [Acorus calamus]
MTPNKQPSLGTTSGNTTHPTPSQDTQNRSASGLMQSSDNFSHGKLSSLRNQLKVTVPDNGFVDVASNGWGWMTVDKFRPGLQYGMMNENRSSDMLSEQNRGPRTNRLKGQWASSIPVKAHSDRAGASNVQENIIIYADQFNKEDFSVNYLNAKFFVIKSYSEDDVHKSIKYNVWSSTSSGNKKLATAYEDAQRLSAGNPKGCPIFLFFSVNASGQFCGVAEMVGPVDFHKDMDFWQQDKWTGSFPVKWHIVKDVPNTNFRNIILENNENKPVTNSRDTQEITFVPGIMMLNIFKNSPLKTSLLDDFMYYEERQKIQQEEKSRFLGRTYDGSFFVPATVPSNNLNSMVIQPSKTNGTADQPPIPAKKHIEYKDTGKTNDTFNQPPNSEEKHVESDGTGNISTMDKQVNLNSMVIQPLKANGKADQSPRAAKKHIEYKDTGKINDTFNQPPKSEEKHIDSDGVGNTSTGAKQVHLNGMVIQPSKTNGTADQPQRAAKKHIEYKVTGKINDSFNQPPNSDEHIESDGAGNTSIKDKQVNSEADGARPSKVDGMKSKLVEDDSNVNAVIKIGSLYIESKAPVTERDTSEDVVTVGTIPVKINGFKGERFPVLTMGTISLNPGAFKRDN